MGSEHFWVELASALFSDPILRKINARPR